jgi:hypothetical protein
LNFEFFRGLTVRGYATLCVALVRYLKSIISTTTLKSEHIIGGHSVLVVKVIIKIFGVMMF